MKQMYLVIAIVIAFNLFTESAAIAHEDPMGDVRPKVQVVGTSFIVEYWNYNEQYMYRRTFSESGREQGSAKRLAPLTQEKAWQDWVNVNYVLEKDDLRVPQFYKSEENPYIEKRQLPDGEWSRTKLPWDALSVSWVTDVLIEKSSITFLVALYGSSGLHIIQFRDNPLHLYRQVNLGVPVTIYHFPVASSIVATPKGYVVAWITAEDSSGGQPSNCGGSSLLLSVWNPDSNQANTKVLRTDIHWNTHVAIGVMDENVLVAYHQGSGSNCLEDSTIEVAYTNLDAN